MKTKLFLLLTCICCVSIYGQYPDFVDHIITDDALGAWSVFAADLDGDNDMDVLSASVDDNDIAWYENTDGQGNFGPKQIIDGSQNVAVSVYAADIDGDDDMDVIACGFEGDVSWYENTNGQGSFTKHIIEVVGRAPSSVFTEDFNGDGDMDVLVAFRGLGAVSWYDNTNGLGTFTERIITTDAESVRTIYAADFDGDGDMDVLSGSTATGDGKLVWYKNDDGLGNFTTQPTIVTHPDGVWRNTAADIDFDGDMDVIAALDGNLLNWYENTDGQGNFDEHVLSVNASGCDWIYAVDLNDDGKKDVLAAEWGNNAVICYYNLDGQGGSWFKDFIRPASPHAGTVHAADINGNGLKDVISGWSSADTVCWHEQGLGIDDNMLSDFSVYPNPTTGILNVQSKTAIVQIEIHNLLGQLVSYNTNQNTIDISSVSQGVYYIKVMDENGDFGTQKVVKN